MEAGYCTEQEKELHVQRTRITIKTSAVKNIQYLQNLFTFKSRSVRSVPD